MLQREQRTTFILSAELSGLSENENKIRTNILENILSDVDIPFQKCKGVYKGTAEQSFICIPTNKTDREFLLEYTFENFQQESILKLDSHRTVSFIYGDGTEDNTSKKLRKVSEAEAKKCDGYTQKSDGTYWILK